MAQIPTGSLTSMQVTSTKATKVLLQGVEPSGDFQRLFYLASRIVHPSFTSILITFKFKLLQTYLQQRRCTHSYLPNKNND